MYGTGNKKMLNIMILNLLEEYSDQNHRLSQQEIIRLLKINYDIECDRRSVKNNVLSLKEMGYEISMEDGYYLMTREFEDAELRLLIDCVLCSKNMTNMQAHDLIMKLKKKGNRYFSPKVSHISNLAYMHHSDNKQLIYSLDAINDAISSKKKIKFTYNTYGLDFKLHPKREASYVVNPYQMVTANGFYYLIGNYDNYNDVAHFRMDKITNVEILLESIKPSELIQGLEHGFNLPQHVAEHIYMFDGESRNIKIDVPQDLINELIDWFGTDFKIIAKTENRMVIRVRCNKKSIVYWALQYGRYIEILEPDDIRAEVRNISIDMAEKYR